MSDDPTVSDPAASWVDALDDFERHLTHVRSVLDHDAVAIEIDWPPEPLRRQAVPAPLVPRARHLLLRAGQLEAELEAKRDAIGVLTAHASHAPRHRTSLSRPSRSTLL